MTPPEKPEEWVAEYDKLKGIKFTELYGAEKAREVRDRRDNKKLFDVYIKT